jgi:hypothetical protein
VPAPTHLETLYHTYVASLFLIFPTLTPSARDVVVSPLEGAQRAVHWRPMRLSRCLLERVEVATGMGELIRTTIFNAVSLCFNIPRAIPPTASAT